MSKDLENELKNVVIKIVSTSGHDEEKMPAVSAVDFIKGQCQDHAKWCFLGTEMVDHNDLTVDDLVRANSITLTNMLVGG